MRTLLVAGLALVPAALGAAPPFTVVEADIASMQRAMREGNATSRDLVTQSLARIATYEDRYNAVISIDPEALAQADARDRERAQGKVRGPLHGIPIALKDNILTTSMPTTGNALAFAGYGPPYEATLVTRLRDAGAIVIAKTTLTELANWVASSPTDMPANYGSLAGYSYNPYDARRDPRDATADGRGLVSTGGSSSGVGTALSFWAANVGTETSGSIMNSAGQLGLVAIKPTVGRVSRHGVIPITADQDTPGPMARSVRDAAILLGAIAGADPKDPATTRCESPPKNDYATLLDSATLKGARIGVPRAFFVDAVTPPGAQAPAGGLRDPQKAKLAEAIAALRDAGAVVVDPADLPSVLETDPAKNYPAWGICTAEPRGEDASCSNVLRYGMKRDFDAFLATLGASAPVKSLAALRRWNDLHAKEGTLRYGQARLDASDAIDLDGDRARYEADRAKDLALTRTHGIDAAMDAHRLDALLFAGSGNSDVAARAGYPGVMLPFGLVEMPVDPPLPAGVAAKPVPFAIRFTGRACDEPKLIALAHAFEQATRARVVPAP